MRNVQHSVARSRIQVYFLLQLVAPLHSVSPLQQRSSQFFSHVHARIYYFALKQSGYEAFSAYLGQKYWKLLRTITQCNSTLVNFLADKTELWYSSYLYVLEIICADFGILFMASCIVFFFLLHTIVLKTVLHLLQSKLNTTILASWFLHGWLWHLCGELEPFMQVLTVNTDLCLYFWHRLPCDLVFFWFFLFFFLFCFLF